MYSPSKREEPGGKHRCLLPRVHPARRLSRLPQCSPNLSGAPGGAGTTLIAFYGGVDDSCYHPLTRLPTFGGPPSTYISTDAASSQPYQTNLIPGTPLQTAHCRKSPGEAGNLTPKCRGGGMRGMERLILLLAQSSDEMRQQISQDVADDQQRRTIWLVVAGVCLFFGILGLVIRSAMRSSRR